MAATPAPIRRLALTSLALAALTAACATTPEAPDRTTVAGQLGERAGVNTQGLPATAQWSAPPGISTDGPLSIDDAVSVALWNNPDFQAALTALGIARGDLITAGAIKNPVLSLLLPWGPKQLEATLNWSIDALWQRPRRINEARINADVVAEQLVAHGLRLIAEVKLAYIDLLSARALAGLAAEQARLARQIASLSDGRLQAGDISELDARLARTDAARLEAASLSRTTASAVALARLRALMGLAPNATLIRVSDAPRTPAAACGTLPDLVDSALAARPDVRAAELAVEAAGERAGLERDKIMTLTAILDMNSRGVEGFEAGPGLAVELPIFSQNQGGKARAVADLDQAGRRYQAVRAAVAADVEMSLLQLRDARAVAEILGDDLATSLRAQRQQAERLFEAGEVSLLDLLDTTRRLIDMETAALDAAFGTERASIRLEQALGHRCRVP